MSQQSKKKKPAAAGPEVIPPEDNKKPDNKQEEQPRTLTIKEQKAEVCRKLMDKFNSPAMRDRLVHLAGGDESLVIANLNSFLTVITNDEGAGKWDDKKFICQASLSSLSLCFMESMQLGIPIDRRGLVHIVLYNWQAELEIDYKGFIYYLNRHYTEADFDIKLVFKGDHFKYWSDSGDDKYEYKQGPERKINNYGEVEWAFFFMTYIKNGRERSKIEVMDKRELDLVRSKAKTKNVWDEWTGEMYKKAVCRRACKLPLAAVDEAGIEAVDNKNFQLEHTGSVDRLQNLIEKQKELTNEEQPKDNQPAANQAVQNGNPAGGDGNGQPKGENAGPQPSAGVDTGAPEAANAQGPDDTGAKKDGTTESKAAEQKAAADEKKAGADAPIAGISDADFEEVV